MKEFSFIKTSLWSDETFRQMSPEQKLIMLYLLQGTQTNWCGIFKLNVSMMGFFLGLREDNVQNAFQAFLKQFSDLVSYDETTSEIAILNWGAMNIANMNGRSLAIAEKELRAAESDTLMLKMIANSKASTVIDFYTSGLNSVRATRRNLDKKREDFVSQPPLVTDCESGGSGQIEIQIENERKVLLEKEPKGDQSTSTPTKAKEKAKRNGAVSLPPAREDFAGFANPDMAMEIWAEWVEYKWEQHKEKYKHKKSEQLMIAKLLQYSGGSIQKARAIIHDAMAKIYKGFFPYEDKMAASAIVPEQKIPEDTYQLPEEMQKRYEASTKKFYEECHLCAGIRWLSKKEYEKVVTKDSDFIGAMWYTKIPNNTFNAVVWDSLSELNKLPRWEKEKWKSVYEWLKKDVSDRVFGRK